MSCIGYRYPKPPRELNFYIATRNATLARSPGRTPSPVTNVTAFCEPPRDALVAPRPRTITVLGTALFWHVSGGPTVELETSLYGGLHFVRGTHMRSWWWIDHFRKHPELKFKIGKEMVYALCLIAMLTCGPSVYRRICRQVTHAPA